MVANFPLKIKSVFFACFALSILCSLNGVIAQDAYELDLQKSIEIAKQKSHQMLILNQVLAQSGHQLRAATSSLKTHVDLNMTIPDYSETIRQWEDSTGITYFPVQQLQTYGSLVINQPLPTDGRLYVSTGLNNVHDYYKNERLMRMNLLLGFYQPLSAFYAYNSIRSEFKKAQLNYELSLRTLKRGELDLIYETSEVFYELVANKERMGIAAQVMKRQQEAYEIAQNKYDAGLIREVEALQMEVDLGEANNDYDLAEVAYQSQMNYFKQKLGLSLQDYVVVVSDMSYSVINVDEEKAVNHGLSNRMELRENEIQIELSKLELKRIKSEGLVKGDITGYYDLIGTNQHIMPYTVGESLADSWGQLQGRRGNFGVALRISVPIFDWGENRSLVRAAESGLETDRYRYDEEKINIEREIRNTVKQFHSSLRRLQLLEKNVLLAEKSFNISRQRFSNGDINSEALAQERIRLNAAYQSHLNSYISYKLLIADIMRKSFFDFENGRPVVQDYDY
jgi:outer membrane protein TolC